MYQLEITLKQHTPLIHFQHDQDGANLRASEVKPRLDRFISEVFIDSKNKCQNGILKFKKSLENSLSLYSIQIEDSGDKDYYLPLPINPNQNKKTEINRYLENKIPKFEFLSPCTYFGNADKIKDIIIGKDVENLNLAILCKKQISLKIKTRDKEVVDTLKESIIDFFLISNFGTRQNKGFGSFEVIKINNSIVESNISVTFKKYYSECYLKNIKQKWYEVINNDYKLLKSGKGRQEGYQKSLIFSYFANLKAPIRWEKRFIKQNINKAKIDGIEFILKRDNIATNTEPIDFDDSQNWIDINTEHKYKFIRALLGLPEAYEFDASPEKIIVKLENETIERFPSPIIFKVFPNKIYLCTNEMKSNSKIFNLKFDLKYKKKSEKKNWEIIDTALYTPDTFSLKNFLEYALIKNNHVILGYTKQ